MGKKYCQLSVEERELIAVHRAEGESIREIGRLIGRDHSAVSRELKRNAPPIHRAYYLAHKAQERSTARSKSAKTHKRLKDGPTRAYVNEKLKLGWSPEQIAGRIQIDHPKLTISHEAICQYVYCEAQEMIGYLPRRHRQRHCKGHSRKHRKSHIPNRVSIETRSEVANTREEAGHWEADAAVSRQSLSAINVIVERKSRVMHISKLKTKTAEATSNAIITQMQNYDPRLRCSITYDNGSENIDHEVTNAALGTLSFFCAPYHSWEKGTVENTIGLVRRYLPKSTDFAKVSAAQLALIEDRLNHRPRKSLDYLTPNEAMKNLSALG